MYRRIIDCARKGQLVLSLTRKNLQLSLLQFRSTLLFLVLLIVLPHLLSLTPQLPQLPLLIQWYCLKMILIMANLRCCTFNCRGWNSGYLSIKNFIDSLDICFIQEHWLLSDQLNKVRDVSPDFLSVGVSGVDCSALL